MNTQNAPHRSKITLRVWKPIYDALVERSDAACVRRDQLITRTLKLELPRIRQELPYRNSDQARRFLEAKLKMLFASGSGSVQMSLALEAPIAEELQEVCDEKNIPREILLNRLLLLLGASSEFLEQNFRMVDYAPTNTNVGDYDRRKLATSISKREAKRKSSDKFFSPLSRIEAVLSDPLSVYRDMLEILWEEIYASVPKGQKKSVQEGKYFWTPFGMISENNDDLLGLTCYLEDGAITESETAKMVYAGSKK